MWRSKVVDRNTFTSKVNEFDGIFHNLGSPPEMCLFVRKTVEGDDCLYANAPDIQEMNHFYSDGWDEEEHVAGTGMSLLIGHHNAWDIFNVPRS